MPGFVTVAYHTGDIQYLFPLYHGSVTGIAHPLNSKQEVLSDQLVAAWTNFMWTGNPNGKGRGQSNLNKPWPRYTTANPLIFTENISSPPPLIATTYSPPITLPPTTPAGLSTETNAQFSAEHHCAFWDTVLQYGP
jgi:para-nitrobenzyl esterase